jgi:hypothetical protein
MLSPVVRRNGSDSIEMRYLELFTVITGCLICGHVSAADEQPVRDRLLKARALEIRFTSTNQRGEFEARAKPSALFINAPPTCDAIKSELAKRLDNLRLLDADKSGALVPQCMIVLYADYLGTKIESAPIVMVTADPALLRKLKQIAREQSGG